MITSMSNNRVKQVVSLQQKAKERKERKCFVIEGLRLFEEAPVELLQEVYVSEQYLDKVKDLEVLKKLPYEVVSADVFQRMSDTKTPQGILAVVKMPEYTMEEILAVEDPLLVLLEDIQDPGNLGTMMRTSEGAGKWRGHDPGNGRSVQSKNSPLNHGKYFPGSVSLCG